MALFKFKSKNDSRSYTEAPKKPTAKRFFHVSFAYSAVHLDNN